jgi:hypothetical protein
MKFFDSEIVRKEILDIQDLQDEVMEGSIHLFSMPMNEKIQHIKKLKELLTKQQTYYTRLSLSDDDGAKDQKKYLEDSARDLGILSDGENLMTSLQTMQETLDKIIEELE